MAKGRKHYSGKELLYMRAQKRQQEEEQRRKNQIEARKRAEKTFIKIHNGFPAAVTLGHAAKIKAK